MKKIINIIAVLICIVMFTGCKSGLEKALSIADEIDSKYNSSSESETTSSAEPQSTSVSSHNITIEVILNEAYYIKYDMEKSYVNMYKKANVESKVIKKFKPDGSKAVKVTAIKEDNDFYYVKYNGKKGYIYKDNLVKDKQKATSATTTTTTEKVIVTQPPTTSYQNNYTAAQPSVTTKKVTTTKKLPITVD